MSHAPRDGLQTKEEPLRVQSALQHTSAESHSSSNSNTPLPHIDVGGIIWPLLTAILVSKI